MAALSPQLFKEPECWSGRSRTHDLPHWQPGAQPTELPVCGDYLITKRNVMFLTEFNQFTPQTP